MEVLTASQMREADRFTIQNEPVSSIDLMERAARKCFEWFTRNVSIDTHLHIVCGPGNNGGDGLALARMLVQRGYNLKISLLTSGGTLSADNRINLQRLKSMDSRLVTEVINNSDIPLFGPGTMIVDAIFGTGLSRNVDGLVGEVIEKINASQLPVISIDLPSGIRSDETSLLTGNEIIKATNTLTFQHLKPALLVGENSRFYGKVEVLDIGLSKDCLKSMQIGYYTIDRDRIQSIFKPKWEFSHKGNFGHSLLITGGSGKMGAAILAAGGYLRSGAGLLSILVPEQAIPIVQTAVPEAMAIGYSEKEPMLPGISGFSVIGAGPGIGTGATAIALIDQVLTLDTTPMVLDADALNILSAHHEWWNRLKRGSILTPHPGEFRRMAGTWNNDFEKLDKQRDFAVKYKVFVILKGKNSSIACPDGTIWFNPTGNSGMAKGGSGDVLTGLLTGLLASGYNAFETCIMGTWLHGLAGDIAAADFTREGMKAGDIINSLPTAWKEIVNHQS